MFFGRLVLGRLQKHLIKKYRNIREEWTDRIIKKLMKKIIFTLGIIIAIGGIILGVTNAYFIDTEGSEDNNLASGTFDIITEGFWLQPYTFTNMYPGEAPREVNFTLRNKGSLPMRIWMAIKNVSNEENGVSDSEQDWYDANGGPKSDVDSAIVYSLDIDGNLALEQEAGIRVSQIKDYYINLVKTDKPFEKNNGDGILYPGETIEVDQKFYLSPKTEDWAQSDIMSFEIEILAQQADAEEPIKQISLMDNTWHLGEIYHSEADGRVGLLKYDSLAENFNYNFLGTNLQNGESYSLIYYADDWPGDGQTHSTGFLIDKGIANSNGILILNGSKDIGTNLPNIDDKNYPYGGKIWLVNSSSYNETSHKINGWNPNTQWLWDNWPGLIRYAKSFDGNPSQSQTVHFNDLGANSQFGKSLYDHYDYSQADVSFAYDTPALSKLSGTIIATGLKPSMTYQVKFIGKPTCDDPSGNDIANEYIGYKGRWTCLDCACFGADCNREDSDYEANKALPDGDPNKECIAGYLVWDYFTADLLGNVAKNIETDNSYHVLWCSGGTCGQTNNSQLNIQDPYPTCAENDVNGQIERFTCNGLVLDKGNYDLDMVLTEESFHQSTYGVWTTVMGTDINFEIE